MDGLKLALITLALVAPTAMAPGCRGPSEDVGQLRLRLDPKLLTQEWPEGPRREAAAAQIRKETRRFAKSLFSTEPMPTAVPEPQGYGVLAELLEGQGGKTPPPARVPPSWTRGTPEPPREAAHDLPQEWRISVRQGETMKLLARWAALEPKTVADDNRKTIGRRRWLRTGDRLVVTMSENQKLAFDQAREQHQQERIQAYFATRYVAKVVVYQVNREESVGAAARRYGKVPIWLLQEFNQTDFRRLKPGDEILIPVIESYDRGQHLPPGLRVVDAEQHPLTGPRLHQIEGRLRKDLLARARLAIDDSNVFERDPHGTAAPLAQGVPPARAPNGADRIVPRAHLAPMLTPPPAPAPPARVADVNVGEPVKMRKVIVKKGETLSHHASWSGLSVNSIARANPGLNPDQIRIGMRLKLPLTDADYARFVLGRSGKSQTALAAAQPLPPTPGALTQRVRPAAPPNPDQRAPRLVPAAIRAPGAPAPSAPQQPPPAAPSNPAAPAPAPAQAAPAAAPAGVVLASAAAPLPARRPTRYHFVASGETASGIALRKGLTLAQLQRLNPKSNLDRIRVGQKLKLSE